MVSFNDYWKKKAAKRKKSWAAKNERFANEHFSIEEIRDKVFMPIDYNKSGYDADAFIITYFKATNPLVVWNRGVFRFSESDLRKAMEDEGADMQRFKMEVNKTSLKGKEAPEPKITDYGKYEWGTSCTNKVWDFEYKYHAYLKQIYKVCTDMESVTLNYREVTMTIKRYTMPDMAFAYYEVNPCTQLMKSPLLMEETGFSVFNIAFLLMDMAAEWELRNEELNYYAKNLKVRKMESVTTDSIDLELWKGLPWKERIKTVKSFMEAITERDCTNEVLDIPFHKYYIDMKEVLNCERNTRKGLIQHFKSVGLQEVNAFHPSTSDNWIEMEYRGCRSLLKYKDRHLFFYPHADREVDFDKWKVDNKRCIEFKRLTISAIAEYLMQMPDLWQTEEQ